MILYFSATGNTRWVVQQIAEALCEEAVYIPEAIRHGQYEYTLKEGERIGFCFPTHGWQPPRIVRDFISHLHIANVSGHFCWALTTCGDNMGEAMAILNKELAQKGMRAETLFSIIMPETYVCLPMMHTDPEEKVQRKVDEASRRMSHIISTIKECRKGVVELEKGLCRCCYRTSSGATSTGRW